MAVTAILSRVFQRLAQGLPHLPLTACLQKAITLTAMAIVPPIYASPNRAAQYWVRVLRVKMAVNKKVFCNTVGMALAAGP